MRLLLLNQYGPPDSPPTARLLGELAEFLRQRGHEIEIVAQRQDYGSRPARGGGRLRRELTALFSIFRQGWRERSPPPDLVLSLSSPPGLPVVAALLAWRHGARLAHWAMDIYPELAVALGEIPAGRVAALVRTAMGWAYRRSSLVVALDEDMRTYLQPLCRARVEVLEPWPAPGIERQIAVAESVGSSAVEGQRWTWLYSGNLGRAHEWRTLLDAQLLLEGRGLPVHLVFQGDGSACPPAMAYATQVGLRNCEWRGYAREKDLLPTLLDAHVLIVTQRPETRGLLWPSKLALLERLPRSILYVGPTDGAIARRLRLLRNTGVFPSGGAPAVANWVEEQFNCTTTASPWREANSGVRSPHDSCATLERWLEDCVEAASPTSEDR